jgi:putative transposase
VTEVLATSYGDKVGQGFGAVLGRLTEETTAQGRVRNRLQSLAKKAEAKGDRAKARRIRRRNLGAGKLQHRRGKGEAEVKRRVGEAVRNVLASRPSVVVVEDLSHMRGRTKSRKLSRMVSRWMRSALRERLEFRTQAGRSRLETVNAAYTSQTCPHPACGYVHKDNRHGDRFQCLACGYAGDADVIAAMNIAARWNDPEIQPWTPKEQVRAILMARFRRRKEEASALTAPGRTPA